MGSLADAVDLDTLGGDRLAIATEHGTIEIWHAGTDVPVREGEPWVARTSDTDEGPADVLTAVATNPDGNIIAAAGAHGRVHLWTRSDDEWSRASSLDHGLSVRDLAFSADGGYLAAAGDSEVSVWRWSDRMMVKLSHDANFTAIDFARGELLLAAVTDGGQLLLWAPVVTPSGGDENFTFKRVAQGTPSEHTIPLASVAFTARSDLVATVNEIDQVQFWRRGEAGSYAPIADRMRPGAYVTVNRDGSLLVTGERNGRLRFLGLDDSGKLKETGLLTHLGEVRAAALMQGDRHLAVLGRGLLLRVPLEQAALVERACARIARKLSEAEVRDYLRGEPSVAGC
jgi:WD40 repeat protein